MASRTRVTKKTKDGMNTFFEKGRRRSDEFQVSNGNIEVLKTIPLMMQDAHWRKKLRILVIDYLTGESCR